ncbi:molybdate-binding periplasmic protein precursor [mine drainage metagenome]|uniref:Molybdate-binding periplasmic protein n=1 Tax=mine drainage metagenome TaxID=410659 RepID=A0A1J5Q4X5_9ZZZZ
MLPHDARRARTPRSAAVASAAIGLGCVLSAAACAGGSGTGLASSQVSGSSHVGGTLTVFAAASLTGTFTALGHAFEAAHPGTTVRFSFAGSSTLAQQILAGAPVDVFAAASPETMAQVTGAAPTGRAVPVVFARNRLEIAVPAGNPGHVTGLADLTKPALRIALCAPQVPCGAAAASVFAAAGLTPAPDTLEQDVKAVLTKVELGEVDAGLVYRTDVIAGGDAVQGIDFPQSSAAVTQDPIVALPDAPNPTAAEAFVALVRSAQGRTVLSAAGFDVG